MNHNLYLALYFTFLSIGWNQPAVGQPAVGQPTILIRSPETRQVFQRDGFVASEAAKNGPGSSAFGFAKVPLSLRLVDVPANSRIFYRLELVEGAVGRGCDWTALEIDEATSDTGNPPQSSERTIDTYLTIPAGGWYRLNVRAMQGDQVIAERRVDEVGVGELFLVAGQSYATNTNDERLRVTDVLGRVSSMVTPDANQHPFPDTLEIPSPQPPPRENSWRIAHDPQPTPDHSDGGSIWPPIGDALAEKYQVPIGFANVAVGATSSDQWLPGGPLHGRLMRVGASLGRFRAVLWQQGESDVIGQVSTEAYQKNLESIRQSAADAWNFAPSWLLAKSTHHPTVYNDRHGEDRIRFAVDALVKKPGFHLGPDTDALQGENRGDGKSRRHFSGIGQRRAAERWTQVLQAEIELPLHESIMGKLSDWHLLQPAWSSEIVFAESSVLFQKEQGDPPQARLGFEAMEILEIRSAAGTPIDRNQYHLESDRTTLTFINQPPVALIRERDLFLPANSPHSYQHRMGQVDQFLLYRPGRWFHDRNIEITYRREPKIDLPETLRNLAGSLPSTRRLLQEGRPFTIGVSGDSISTGLDASFGTQARPFQPGFAELIAGQIELTWKCDVQLVNRAVSGWSVANGVQDIDQLLSAKPDLVLIAYGMNDVGRRDPEWYGRQTQTMVERIQGTLPDTEVLLISPMLGNREWQHTPRDMFGRYREELRKLTGPGVALADVTAAWELLMRHKHDLDLTGNGLNHPNDYGHRLYAQVILSSLSPTE